jgi:hypothetical protein
MNSLLVCFLSKLTCILHSWQMYILPFERVHWAHFVLPLFFRVHTLKFLILKSKHFYLSWKNLRNFKFWCVRSLLSLS